MKYKIAAVISVIVLGFIAFTHLAPASLWLDVRDVYVYDAVVGEVPLMEIDRTINQPFRGSYVVDVEKLNQNGSYTPVCTSFSATNYRPDAQLPEPVTLDWWSFPTQCNLDEGVYRVETSWAIKTEWFPDKFVFNVSNTFTVRLPD